MKTRLHLGVIFLLLSITTTFGQNYLQLGLDINGESNDDKFGQSVSMSDDGTRIVIGAPGNRDNGIRSGHVRVYQLNGSGEWIQLGNDVDGENQFDESGSAVSISGDGNLIAIGAIFNEGNGEASGHVRVYQLNASNQWIQLGVDIDAESAGDRFGWSVSLAKNGNRLAVGAVSNDGNASNAGHVRVYELNASNQWIQLGADIDGDKESDNLGRSLDLNGEGNRLVIGASGADTNGLFLNGLAKVYELNTSNEWVQLGMDINGEAQINQLGYSVSINEVGNRVVVSSYSSNSNGNSSGHVQVFELNTSNQWIQLGSNINGEAAADFSGFSVSINADGDKIAIGATENDGNGNKSGHVRIYQLNNNAWVQLGMDIDGMAAEDVSGTSVSINADGTRVGVGAPLNDTNGNGSGHVRVYELSVTVPVATVPTVPSILEDEENVTLGDDIEITDAGGENQTVSYTITGGVVTLGSTNITFGGNGNGSSSFTAQGTLVDINAALDAATFTPDSNLSGSNIATIAFKTNDGLSDSNTASVTFSIIPVNDVPVFTLPTSPNQVVNEDLGEQTVNGFATGIDDGDSGVVQNMTFDTTISNTALFSNQPRVEVNTGNLTYTPALNAVGTATITLRIRDSGGTTNGGIDTSAEQTFTITLSPVNDVPVFTILTNPNQVVNEDSGVQTVNGFTTGIEDGDSESTQVLTFNVSNDNNALFSVQPMIDVTTGSLSYTPMTNTFGVATVTVNLSDNGGTANGGIDTSDNQTFTITVNDVKSPTVNITSTLTGPTGANPIPVTITFNEVVTGFDTSDISASNASITNFNGSDAIYTIDLVPSVTGAITININQNIAIDGAGNGNDAAPQFSIDYDTTLSTEEFTLDKGSIVFYPNPTRNKIFFKKMYGLLSAKLYSLQGKLLLFENLKDNEVVDVSELSKGVYILRIETEKGTVNRKLIKD